MARKSMIERLAEEDLRDYRLKKQAVETLQDQIARYNYSFTAIRSATTDSTPVSGALNMREEALTDNICMRIYLKAKLDEAQMFVKAVDSALSVLDARERLIIARMYIYPEKDAIERLKSELNLEQSQIYYYKDLAMSKFRKAYYGV